MNWFQRILERFSKPKVAACNKTTIELVTDAVSYCHLNDITELYRRLDPQLLIDIRDHLLHSYLYDTMDEKELIKRIDSILWE